MAVRIVRSIDEILHERPRHSELRLSRSFFWGKADEGPPEIVRKAREAHELYERYNPGIREALERTAKAAREGMTMTQAEDLIESVRYVQIKHFFEQNRRLKSPRGKLFQTAVNRMIAEFMPVIEDWKTIEQLADELCVSNSTIANHCAGDDPIDSIARLKRYWISPIGENELRSRLWSRENRIMRNGTWHYSISSTAREAVANLTGITRHSEEQMIKRIAHLVRSFPDYFGQVQVNGRKYLSPQARYVLTDIVTQKEASDYLGISRFRIVNLGKKEKVQVFRIGETQWYSGYSLRAYRQGHGNPRPMVETEVAEPYSARDVQKTIERLCIGEDKPDQETYQVVSYIHKTVQKRMHGGVVGQGDFPRIIQGIDDAQGILILQDASEMLEDFSPYDNGAILALRRLSDAMDKARKREQETKKVYVV
jgi:hypothetical protein